MARPRHKDEDAACQRIKDSRKAHKNFKTKTLIIPLTSAKE